MPARRADPVGAPLIGEAFGGDGDPALNLNIEVTFPPRNPYEPGDQPVRRPVRARLPGPGPTSTGRSPQAQAGEYYCPTRPTTASTPTTAPATGARLPRRQRPGRRRRPRATATRRRARRCPTSWPARRRSWTSCAASSATRPARARRRLRPVGLDAGAAAAREGGDAPMKGQLRGLAGPLVKLRRLRASSRAGQLRADQPPSPTPGTASSSPTGPQFTDVAGLVEGDEVRIAGVRVGQVDRHRARRRDRPAGRPRSSSRWPPTCRCPPASRRRSATATWSGSATSR